MALSKPQIDAVVREIAPAIRGGRVQKVFQPGPRAITLEIRAPGRTLALLLSAEPDQARLHLLTARVPNPPEPPGFCRYLRAHLQGAVVESLTASESDRIATLRVTTPEGPRSLVALLTGRSADLLLLDAGHTVLKSLRDDRQRTGQPFQPPVPPAPTGPTAAAPGAGADDAEAPFPVSRAIERQYMEREAAQIQRRRRDEHLGALNKAIKKLARRAQALRADLEKASRYRGFDRYGELIKANLGSLRKGQTEVTVTDYFDPAMPELTLPLDPGKTPQANMADYFNKHRKHLAAERELTPRLNETEGELSRLRETKRAIEAGELDVPAESARAGPAASSRPASGPASARRVLGRPGPFRRFVSSDGLPIYVGRNAKENDELTLKFARGDDLWLHARGVPGSHVVVRMEKGASVPPETLRDAAVLALLYSELKKSGKGDVLYTRKKWVRKAKGQGPGTVTVTQDKSLFVTLDKARLEALKDRSA